MDPHITWDGSYPTLVIVRGLPGGGKTFLAAELRKILGPAKTIVLDPDAVDLQSKEYIAHSRSLAAEGVDTRLHLYRFLRAEAYQAIEDRKLIIWNQPFTNLEIFQKMIQRLNERAADCGTELSILVVEVDTDPTVAASRIQLRKQAGGHGPSPDVFDRFVHDYRSFADQGFTTVTVRGESDVQLSATKVVRSLDDIWQRRQAG